MFKEKFAKNLRDIRKSRKLTQEQLAELVGVDFRYISLLENAKSFPSCDLIEKLVKALNINYSELFAFDEDLSREEIENRLGELIKFISDKNLKILYNIAKEI
ncbi:transcriptional regulator XRE family [Clostridium sp. CAG:967]|nr:transcriptional regulator XRE family [Clostridium sp. CAG:967]